MPEMEARRRRSGRLFAALLLATGGLYLAMVIWTLPTIAREAGGLVPFDMRPLGYSADEAAAFLAALSEKGLAVYRGPQRLLDALFPAALAASSVWAAVLLWGGVSRWGIVLLAVVAAAADYTENFLVARLLGGFDGGLAGAASLATVVKSGASTLVYTALLIGLLRLIWRRRAR